MKKYIYLIIGIYFCVISCKKEVSIYTAPKTTNNNVLVFGNSQLSNSKTTVLNPQLVVDAGSNGGSHVDSIDINNDGIYDICINTYSFHWGNQAIASISTSNNNISFLVNIVYDSICFTSHNLNTSVTCDSVIYNTHSGFISGQQNDTLLRTTTDYYMCHFSEGDTLPTNIGNKIWYNVGLLNYYVNGYYYDNLTQFVYYRRGDWSGIGTKYLAFKMIVGNSVKYGWLKINTAAARVTSYEYSIQN